MMSLRLASGHSGNGRSSTLAARQPGALHSDWFAQRRLEPCGGCPPARQRGDAGFMPGRTHDDASAPHAGRLAELQRGPAATEILDAALLQFSGCISIFKYSTAGALLQCKSA